MAEERLSEIRKVRTEKLKKLSDLGVNPYPSKPSGDYVPISRALDSLGEEVSIVGRVMAMRGHGNISFADIKDESAQIQLWFSKKGDNVTSDYENLNLVDIGDFLHATGKVTKTEAGETTIKVDKYELLTKSIRPLPSTWHGLKDEEARYRQRYVDLILNDDLKDLFRRKAIFWQSMREFLTNEGFLEVETPVLENTAGGADANPFVTHHNALDIDLYLRISMGELWQKRLMVAGFEKTFEIGRQFRNEGISREHLQDYTQMEFYWAYHNYEDSMELVEKMYKHVAEKTFGKLEFEIGGRKINLGQEWKKIDYTETIKEKTGVDISKVSEEDLKAKLEEQSIDFNKNDSKGRLIDILWKSIRKDIDGPVFLTGHPVEVSPLAKRMHEKPEFTERYQVIIAGSEQGNGYSELNDPIDQAERFADQQKMRDDGDEEAQMHDYDFVRALEYGMPPVTGFGVSERLFSFLADKPIRETVLFPLLRPEFGETKSKSVIKTTGDYSISDEIKSKFPGVSYAYTVIRNVNITKRSDKLEKKKKEVLDLRGNLKMEDLDEIAPIEAYRMMFKETGVKLGSRKPSPEALLRRIIQKRGLYNINTAVDAYNLAVIESGFGLGGFDYDKIADPVVLRLSKQGETMHLLGDEKTTQTKSGEIVYSDHEKLLTLDLNYRDINQTKITDKTKNIILFADGGPGLEPLEVKSALEKGAKYIQQFCGGEIGDFTIVK